MTRERFLILVTTVVALSVFLTPAARELFAGDETKYAQVVREMRAGAVFLPTLEGTPFTHKPPLHFWMIGALTYLFGVYSTWSFVLPSIAGFIALMWLLWRMEGPLAAFICGTSLMMWGSAQTARMDVTFTLAIGFAVWMIQRERPVAAGVATGIATLIKGPMAAVIVILLFVWRRASARRMKDVWAGAVLMLAIPLLWFVPAMIIGGGGYTREVLVKQTAGRAVGAWVHRSPLWFYVVRSPADLFPWFPLLVVAIFAAYRRDDERAKFYAGWILAVLVPYSLMSSKLDVYMMAMIPPMAVLIARLLSIDDEWLRRSLIANRAMLAILLIIGVAGLFVPKLMPAKPLFVALALGAVIGLASARNAIASTVAVGLVTIVAFAYAAVVLMPLANEMASDRPLVRALVAQRVAPDRIALYTAPHLWTHDMPRDLERVRYVSADMLRAKPATVVVTSRSHASEIADVLRAYRKVAEFQLIGKPFDVYR